MPVAANPAAARITERRVRNAIAFLPFDNLADAASYFGQLLRTGST
jgi:hypothetical protein